MPYKFFLPIFLFCVAFSLPGVQAQSLIALKNKGQYSFFTELQPALDAAVDGITVEKKK